MSMTTGESEYIACLIYNPQKRPNSQPGSQRTITTGAHCGVSWRARSFGKCHQCGKNGKLCPELESILLKNPSFVIAFKFSKITLPSDVTRSPQDARFQPRSNPSIIAKTQILCEEETPSSTTKQRKPIRQQRKHHTLQKQPTNHGSYKD